MHCIHAVHRRRPPCARPSQRAAFIQLAEAGVGVAVMPRSAARRRRNAKALIVPSLDAWARRTLLIRSTDRAAELPGVRSPIEALLVPQPRQA